MYEYVTEDDVWLYYSIMKVLGRDLTPSRLDEIEKYAKKILKIVKKMKPDENGVRIVKNNIGEIRLSPSGVLSFPWMNGDAIGYKYISDENRILLSQEDIDDMNASIVVMPDFTDDAIKVAKQNSRKKKSIDIDKYTKARFQKAVDTVILYPHYERNLEEEYTCVDYGPDEFFSPVSALLLAKYLKVDIFRTFGEPFMFSCKSEFVSRDAYTKTIRKFNNNKSFVEVLKMLECQEKMPTPLVRTRKNNEKDKSLLSDCEYNAYMLNMLQNYVSTVLNLFTPLRIQKSKRTDMKNVTIMVPSDASLTRLYNIMSNLEPKTDVSWSDSVVAANYIRGVLYDAKLDFEEITIPYGGEYTVASVTPYVANSVAYGRNSNRYDITSAVRRLKNNVCSFYDAIYEITDNNPAMRNILEELGLLETGYHPTFHEEGLYLPEFPNALECKTFISTIRCCSSYGNYLEKKSCNTSSELQNEANDKYNKALSDIRMQLFGVAFTNDIDGFVDKDAFIARFMPAFERAVKRRYVDNPKSFDQCHPAVNDAMSEIFKEEFEARGIAV